MRGRGLARGMALMAVMMAGVDAAAWEEVTAFGDNPGNLRMFKHVPGDGTAALPLVVLLHGCGQDASSFAQASGWRALSDRMGFILVAPEQKTANNQNRCFNWFEPGDTARDAGEAMSIRNMVAHMLGAGGVDAGRVFVTGLSSGGAMAAVMLATYPDLFSAGGVVAGVPYRCATDLQGAYGCMTSGRDLSAAAWGDQVRGASTHQGPFPRITVWHGNADATVNPSNGGALVTQWRDVHALPETPSETAAAGPVTTTRWKDASGNVLVERNQVSGMGHGIAVYPGVGAENCGTPGPFLLDVGVCTALRVARFLGLDAPPNPRDGGTGTSGSAGGSSGAGVSSSGTQSSAAGNSSRASSSVMGTSMSRSSSAATGAASSAADTGADAGNAGNTTGSCACGVANIHGGPVAAAWALLSGAWLMRRRRAG